ncbi:MAG: hypothetical protein AAFO83_15375, partial [Cyanobacteria bacterium J06607_13]
MERKTTTFFERKRKQAELDKAREAGVLVKAPRVKVQYICKKCGEPKLKETGHSRYKNEHYCAKTGGRSVEEWLAEK